MECQTTRNTLLSNKVHIREPRRRKRSCSAGSCHRQRAKGSKCGRPARMAENEFQACSISDNMEQAIFAPRRPKDKNRKYFTPEGQKIARSRNNAEQAEHRLVLRKRRILYSTPAPTSAAPRSTALPATNACNFDETWPPPVKPLLSALRTQSSGVSCSARSPATNEEMAGSQEVTSNVNRRAVKEESPAAHNRRYTTEDSSCTLTEDCDQSLPGLPLHSPSVPGHSFSLQRSPPVCPLQLLKGHKSVLTPSVARCPVNRGSSCINGASVCVTPDRTRRRSAEASSSVEVSKRQCRETAGPHTARQGHITTLAAKELPAATLCRVRQRYSLKDMDAEKPHRERNPPSLTVCASYAGPEDWLPNLSQRNPHLSEASLTSEGLLEQHAGLPDACKSCLFVNPYLLLPLLPPASAFTNPCWPPTPPKKRRGLHHPSGTYHIVPHELLGTGDCKRIIFPERTSDNQYCESRSPCVSGSCSSRAFTDIVSSNDSIPPPAGLVQCNNDPCKTCATKTHGHHNKSTDKVLETAHKGSRRECEGKERDGFYWRQRTHCHKAAKNCCLIEGGDLFQCVCCSPWLPRRAPRLVEDKRAWGDEQAGRATVSMDWIHRTEPQSDTRLRKPHDTCCRGGPSEFKQRVDCVPRSAEGDPGKQTENVLHRTSLLIRRRQVMCDFADGRNAIVTEDSLSQHVPPGSGNAQHTCAATKSYVTSEKASSVVKWKATPERQPRVHKVGATAATVQGRTHVLFEEPRPHKIHQEEDNAFSDGRSLYKRGSQQEQHVSRGYSLTSITAHKINTETPGIKGEVRRTGVPQLQVLHAEVHPHFQSPLITDKSHRLLCTLCHNSSASDGKRHVGYALPTRRDRFLNKLSGFSSPLLLPSIGCGLAVAQSSLGRGSGLGLYAVKPFSARSRISEYSGLCVDRKVAMLLRSMGTSTHVMRVGMQHQYLVGYRLPFLYGAAGAFVNDGRWYADGRRGPGIGARFQVVYDKKRARDRVYVVATRDIKAGEEIFTSYDNLYWALME